MASAFQSNKTEQTARDASQYIDGTISVKSFVATAAF
jgi:hypothetical protein